MATTKKIDLFKEPKSEYASPKTPQLVETTPGQYLTIEGQGEPGGEEFVAKVGAMYGVAFTTKMTKKQSGPDYKVAPMETVLWGAGEDFVNEPRSEWRWKIMIRTPDFVTEDDLEAKGKGPLVAEVNLETASEGQCVQLLHIGPYDQEAENVQRMAEFASEQGLRFHGRHHEIYLSDPRRVPPERLRTIIRHPVK